MRVQIMAGLLWIIYATGSIAQQGWIKQSPPPYQYPFNDVHLSSENNAIVIGDKGMIIKTENGGTDWKIIESGTKSNLMKIHFIDGQTGWITGSSSTILKTNDGGNTWKTVNTDLTSYLDLSDVYFKDANTGWVLSDGAVYKTTDGGLHWNQKLKTASLTYLQAFSFLNEYTAIAVGSSGSGKIFRTTDGGENWADITLQSPAWLYAACFVDAQNCWAAGLRASNITISSGWTGTSISIDNPVYTLWNSTNGGVDWTQKNLNYSGRIYGIDFINKNVGWAVGEQGLILRTQDGGTSWNMIKTVHNLYAVHFINGTSGFAVGDNGTMLMSSNEGNTWKLLSGSGTRNSLYSVIFFDKNIGLAVGSGGTIMHTTTGGELWSDYYISLNSSSTSWTSICFPDTSTGYLLGNGFNNILKTSNSGKSWTWTDRQSSWYINSAFFINPTNGWLAGEKGVIGYRTGKDMWNAWTSQTSGTDKDLYSIFFLDTLTGWAVGEERTILHTSDGGKMWVLQNSGLPKEILSYCSMNAVYFVNSSMGFIACSSGILKTENGGSSWAITCDIASLYAIDFYKETTGWVVGYKGMILKTEDGGKNWIQQKSSTNETLKSIFCYDDKTVWIVGDNGIILKTVTGGGENTGVDEAESKDQKPEGLLFLTQNFPNPFNQSTAIVFELPKAAKVKLKIYNMLGQEIETLCDGWMSSGKHKRVWTSNDLPSGIYFYRLYADDQVLTKKLLLQQ
jgi:photosystem II stability/assembly factor-like uncharacterized protein